MTLSRAPQPGGAAGDDAIPEEFYRFERHPGYLAARAVEAELFRSGLPNPYFRSIEGIAGATATIEGRSFINFASYNYLGLSGDPRVSEAAVDAIRRYGTSASASRLASGERPLHRALEAGLAELLGVADALVFVSGHATNVTVIGHLFGRKDLILHDALIHNSVMQGCLLSGAKRVSFPHNDWAAVDGILSEHRRHYERVLIVLEGVYSMDGDLPDLPRFLALRDRHKTFLMVDEAHALGVVGRTGRGLGEHFGLAPDAVDLWMGTLSKTLASCGGYIGGCQALVDYLRYTAPGFLFSVGLSPPDAASALAALRILRREPERVALVQARARLFLDLAAAAGLRTGCSHGSAVIPVIVGHSHAALGLSQALFEHGIFAQPIVHPAVTSGNARVRFFLTALHTEEQIAHTVACVSSILRGTAFAV
ncbi:MAG: aminotransferase class I/II-fold pyridoxal phosphate-dependent enzyme [Alphaproteobacteria bacterium]|nr:aminotransferase class I/II-fold pyridoxal phosphate-dependent enzyme [Alphaproteobacteria bacterium]